MLSNIKKSDLIPGNETNTRSMRASKAIGSGLFFPTVFSLCTMIVYTLMGYGGIRSPDSEVVFRTTEALATRGTFAVSEKLSWKKFGLSVGKDGKRYSLFGPAEAVAAVPLYGIARLINTTRWYEKAPALVPVSHYVGDGVIEYAKGETPTDLEPHALRFVVCLFNPIVSSMCVFFFFLIVRALTQSEVSARLTTILFAFGSLVLPYAGTFFSEPLATLFVLLSLYFLVYNHVSDRTLSRRHTWNLAGSAISLGLATATHVTAILYVPFFCFFAIYSLNDKTAFSVKRVIHFGSLFLLGVGVLLVLLAVYNYARFGSVLETGRTALSGTTPKYGVWVAPWRGLWALLISSGKGLLLFCPAVLLSIVGWKHFHRKHRVLSYVILGSVVLRLVFIASRSDWHGGFCLGPRYMVMLVPLLILPVGELISTCISAGMVQRLWAIGLYTFFCIAQQLYFAMGEIFVFLHIVKWNYSRKGVDVFENNFLYLNWEISPLIHLLQGRRGPFSLSSFDVNNYVLWSGMLLCTGVLLFLAYRRFLLTDDRELK